jgi:hypothetical protein
MREANGWGALVRPQGRAGVARAVGYWWALGVLTVAALGLLVGALV